MKKVIVAMSGGIDSSVAAFLLKRDGYKVEGLSIRLWSDEPVGAARAVAKRLCIPHHVVDLKRNFQSHVVDYFCAEYARARTPNPCLICNEKIKFAALSKEARKRGASFVATGHYARPGYDKARRRYFIREAEDKAKDQSYFLFSLSQRRLRRILFPLGDLTKEEVKEIARRNRLLSVTRAESQDICFITHGNYRDFIKKRVNGIVPGDVIDTEGKVLGRHKGFPFYTIGQREGLGVSAGKPLYVVKIDAERNLVVLGEAEAVKGRELRAAGVLWMGIDGIRGPYRATAKIRYNHPKAACRIIPISRKEVKIIFDNPQYAITPGQAVVFYDGDKVLGGGWIK